MAQRIQKLETENRDLKLRIIGMELQIAVLKDENSRLKAADLAGSEPLGLPALIVIEEATHIMSICNRNTATIC